MTLELNEQKVIAQLQKFQFENLVIEKQGKNLSANIQFAVYNEKDERIGTQNHTYRQEEFNRFWSEFTTGKYLYEELVKKSMLTVEVPEIVEEDFVWVKPEEAPVIVNNTEDEENGTE